MRHSEPSPAIHNVEMPGLTPSLEHVESDPTRRSLALPLLLPGTLVTLGTLREEQQLAWQRIVRVLSQYGAGS